MQKIPKDVKADITEFLQKLNLRASVRYLGKMVDTFLLKSPKAFRTLFKKYDCIYFMDIAVAKRPSPFSTYAFILAKEEIRRITGASLA